VGFNVTRDLSLMCTGCHPWKPHPGGAFSFFSKKEGPDHLVVPSKDVARRMKRMERKNDVVFPLEPGSGKMFCGTCHNSHEKGVVRSAAADRGADSKHRLRLTKMCTQCHEK